jgi:hypothetical protein
MLLIEANDLLNLIKLEIPERWFHRRSRPNSGCITHSRVDFTASQKLKEKT